MVTESSSLGAGRSSIILGSGLSGMVAAYINARALEDDASNDGTWQAQQAFRPRGPRRRARRAASDGGSTAVAS